MRDYAKVKTLMVMIATHNTNVCRCCGNALTLKSVHFHHVESATKKYHISTMIANGYSIDTITKELSKCDALCKSCHDSLHMHKGQRVSANDTMAFYSDYKEGLIDDDMTIEEYAKANGLDSIYELYSNN